MAYKKDRVAKDTGNYVFADFSRGLYALDTPRTMGEQLGSLALIGGRNIWSEKGALVNQHGYQIKYQVPIDENGIYVDDGLLFGEVITAVSKATYGVNTVFITTASGKVFIYSPQDGLKLYKTPLPTGEEGLLNPLLARRAKDFIISHEGDINAFGGYYPESATVVTSADINYALDGNIFTATCPIGDINYYWFGKDIVITDGEHNDQGIIDSIEEITTREAVTMTGTRTVEGHYEDVAGQNASIVLKGTLSFSPTTYPERRADDVRLILPLSNYTYDREGVKILNQDTFKITIFRGALGGSQAYSYSPIMRTIVGDETQISEASVYLDYGTTQTFTYSVTMQEGSTSIVIKLYDALGNLLLTHTHTSEQATTVADIQNLVNNVSDLSVEVHTKTSGTRDFIGQYSTYGVNEITNAPSDIYVSSQESHLDATQVWIPERTETYEYIDYVDVNHLKLQGRVVGTPSIVLTAESVSIGEKCLYQIPDLTYTPEEGSAVILNPKLLAVSNNRLYVVHEDGNIYYSQIGVMDSFDQSLGAGYFGGFYQDTSETLSIEEFLEGTLICKRNGIYFLTIGDTLEIKKISQVGQEYASDHVIVGEKVYAYDTNSGTIVNAVAVNVFGSLVSGKPLITSEELNAENMGINASKRWLTYNAESEVFILYYGVGLRNGIVLTKVGTIFPRELNITTNSFVGFNQGVLIVADNGTIAQDFKKGTIIPNLSSVVNFENIGVRDNRLILSSILEISELNGIEYTVTTSNSGYSSQLVTPSFNTAINQELLPPLLYSEDNSKMDSFAETSKWAELTANVSRIAAPMSGREGVGISLEFPANISFCLAALRLADFSQGV